MDIKDMSRNGSTSTKRMDVSSSAPSGGITNVSSSDNDKVLMNTPEPKDRGSRCDELIETMGDDGYKLTPEAPRMSKMKG